MSDSTHSIVSPSGLYRVFNCPGSVNQSKNAPAQAPSEYALRGTAQHDAVVRRWNGRPIGHYKLTEQENNNVDDCIDYLHDLLEGQEASYAFEVKGDLSNIGIPEIWGTRDVDVRINGDRSEHHVIDWKFGQGVAVEVEDNPQLLAYLLMGVKSVNSKDLPRMFIHLVQPPLNYYGVQEVEPADLTYFSNLLIEKYNEAMQPNAPIIPGEKQCRFCPAAMTCRGRYNYQLGIADEVFDFVQEHPKIERGKNVSVVELAEIYSKLNLLIDYAKEIGKYGQAELMADREFPGYKLVHGRSIRKWRNEKTALAWLQKYSGLKDFHSKPKILSPAQIEKKAKHLKKDQDFQVLIEKPPGSLKMAPDDDVRKAITKKDIDKGVFNAY